MGWQFSRSGSSKHTRLIWFHGFMGSSLDWHPFADHFQDFENILLDLPGHGLTQMDGNEDAQFLFKSLKNQLEDMESKRNILIGYSMGGRVALHFWQHYPALVQGLIGLSCTPGLESEPERVQRLRQDDLLMDKLERVGFREFLRDWYQLPLFGTLKDQTDLRNALTNKRADNRPHQLRRSLSLLGNGALPNIWADLDSFDVPILMGCGSEDRKYRQIRDLMKEAIPHMDTFDVDGCSHAFHLEKPLETMGAMRHFLGNRFKGV